MKENNTQKCPLCGEILPKNTTMCEYCGKSLQENSINSNVENNDIMQEKAKLLTTIIAAVCFILTAVIVFVYILKLYSKM